MKNVPISVWLVMLGIAVLIAGIYAALAPMGLPDRVEAHESSVHALTLTCPTSVNEGERYDINLTMDDKIIVRGVEGSWHWQTIPGWNAPTMVASDASDEEKATADLLYWEGGLNEVTSPAEYVAREINHTFSILEDDTTELPEHFRLYFKNNASGGHGGAQRYDVYCDIKINDDDPPTVEAVRMSKTPKLNNTYQLGDYILIDVEFDDAVTVIPDWVNPTDGTDGYYDFPKLQFWLDGDGDDEAQSREAVMDGAYNWETSGTNSERTLVENQHGGYIGKVLRFQYQVKAGDYDADGLTIGAHTSTGLGENLIGWSQRFFHYADHTFEAQADLSGHKIDGRFRPVDLAILDPADNPETSTTNDIWTTPANGEYYRPGETIRLTYYFNDDFDVVGNENDVSVDILMGYDGEGVDKDSTRRRARGYDISKRQRIDRMQFRYVVQHGDWDADGIEVDANSLRGLENLKPRSNPDAPAHAIHPGISEDSGQKVTGGPEVTGISITTTPSNGSYYTYGEDIGIRLTYNTDVTLRGTGSDPWLLINLGDGENSSRRATFSDERIRFVQGNWLKSKSLLFKYRVQAGETDGDGISVTSNEDGTALGGGKKIYEYITRYESLENSVAAVNTYSGIDESTTHRVNTSPFVKRADVISTPRHGDTYGMGETIKLQLTFDQPMTVGEGEFSIPFIMSSPYLTGEAVEAKDKGENRTSLTSVSQENLNLRQAQYHSISGDGTKLVFHYDIQGNDADVDGISLNAVSDDDESVTGTANVKVPGFDIAWEGYYDASGSDLSGHKVDSNPFVTGVELISNPANGQTYGIGENIEIKLTFNEAVKVLGSLSLSFELGDSGEGDGNLRQAQYQSGSDSNELVFRYTVVQGDVDDDGIDLNVGGAGDHTATSGNAVQSISQTQSWDLTYSAGGTDLAGQKVSGSLIGTVPGAPTSLRTTGFSETRIDLNWNAPTVTGGSDITGYRIEISEDDGATWSALVDDTGNADTSYSHTGLARGDARHYRVYATNSAGNGLASNEVSGVADRLRVEFQRTRESGTPTSDTRLRDSFVVRVGLKYPPPAIHYASVDGFDQEDIEVTGGTINRFIRHSRNKGVVYLFINTDRGAGRVTVKVGENAVGEQSTWPAQVYYGSAASIQSLAVTSDPGDDDTYAPGDSIEVTVTFNEAVTVTGTPQLELDFDGTAKTASYGSASGAAVVFSYTVAAGESDSDGIAIGANMLTLNGGTIQDVSGNDATLTHDAVAADSGHKVGLPDTTAPTVSSISITSDPGDDDTYGLDDSIEVTVTFDEPVTVTGTPQLELDFEGTAKTANYSSASGAEVVFSYTVAPNERDSDGIAVGANKLTLNGGTIQDSAGNNATLTHDAVAEDSGHKVDGSDVTAPTISSSAFTSDPGDDNTYRVGDTIEISVTFDENVVVTGTPQLEIQFTSREHRKADYTSVTGAVVVFSYTVVAGDQASDGLEVEANKLTLNGGTIKDPSGNDAVLTHDSFYPRPFHFVDGS